MSDKTKTSLAAQIASSGIDHLADELWENLGGTYPAIVELEVMERTEPSDTEADRKVKLRVVGIEIPRTSMTKEEIRQLRRRLYADRTGDNTLFSGPDLLKHGRGLLTSIDDDPDGVQLVDTSE